MLITKFCYGNPITYDEEKYTYEILNKTTGIVRISDKQNNITICCILLPDMIKQITENEFITVFPKEMNQSYSFLFQHIKYDENTKTTKIIFEKEFQSKSSVFGTLTEANEVYIMKEFLKTILYNTKTKKTLTLEDSQITNLTDENIHNYLKAIVDIEEKDTLSMYIDKQTLEFNGFYSSLQDRFIPIQRTDQTFKQDYQRTVEKEIIKYLELLEIYENTYQERQQEKVNQILRKKLNQKNK